MGSDTFWKVLQEFFHHSDWRVRFQAVERVTVVARFMDSTPLRTEVNLQAALATAFCHLIASMDDTNVYVAQRATMYLGTIHDSAIRVSYSPSNRASILFCSFLVIAVLLGVTVRHVHRRSTGRPAVSLPASQLIVRPENPHVGLFPLAIRHALHRSASEPGEERRSRLPARLAQFGEWKRNFNDENLESSRSFKPVVGLYWLAKNVKNFERFVRKVAIQAHHVGTGEHNTTTRVKDW